MKQIGSNVFLVTLLIACPISPSLAEDLGQCRPKVQEFGACFVVHGRIGRYFGNPEWRIWRTGTQRILSVVPDPAESSNREVAVLGRTLEQDNVYVVFGDFQVCPLAKDVPGLLRDVCIQKVAKVSIKVCEQDAKNCRIEKWNGTDHQ